MEIRSKELAPHVIKISQNGYAVEELTGTNDKKEEVFKNHGYFSSVEGCLLKIVKLKTESKNKTVDLGKYVKMYRKNTKLILSCFDIEKGKLKPLSKQKSKK